MNGNLGQRRNWTRSLTIVIAIAFAGAVIGCLADNRTTQTDRIYLRNSAGAVLFDHGKHGTTAESCATCHHPLYSAAQATACTECHTESAGHTPADVSHEGLKTIHSRDCSVCHEQVQDSSKATSCRDCHTATQPGEELTKKCSECHDDGFTPDMLTHDEYQEIEDHSCLGCHSPRTFSEANHTNCTGCHLKSAPERFAKPDGTAVCGACHLR